MGDVTDVEGSSDELRNKSALMFRTPFSRWRSAEDNANSRLGEEEETSRRTPSRTAVNMDLLARREAHLGWRHDCSVRFVKAIQSVEAVGGLGLCLYGGWIGAFSNPAPPRGAVRLVWCHGMGCGMASALGFLGLFATPLIFRHRWGLVASAGIAMGLAALEFIEVLWVLLDSGPFIQYLSTHHKSLWLGKRFVHFIQSNLSFFCALTLLCSLMELSRCFLLQRIRRGMLRYDVAHGELLLALEQHTRHDDLREPLLVSPPTAPPPTPVQTPNKEPTPTTMTWWDDESISRPVKEDLESSVPRTTASLTEEQDREISHEPSKEPWWDDTKDMGDVTTASK